jgi:hypothetical protein
MSVGRCPHCGGAIPQNRTEDSLRAAAASLNLEVRWDDTISEEAAARLVGWSRWTMRNRRLTDQPIAPIRSGGRWRYSLAALAAYLEKSDEPY